MMQIACGVPTFADLRLERALAVEDLDALVAGVGDVEVARRVGDDAANLVELALARSGVAPRLQEVAVLVELGDAVVGAEAVGDVDVAGAIPVDIRRPVEAVAVDAGAAACRRRRARHRRRHRRVRLRRRAAREELGVGDRARTRRDRRAA